MELHGRMWLVLFGTLMSSCKCEKEEDCSFPVSSTQFCPRNKTEWDKRSSDMNCNETNSYMCVPNERFTELLEFCYKHPRMLIVQDSCLYLSRSHYDVNVYDCRNFEYGCPSYHYLSSTIYKYPSCIHVENGCFVAEPSCKSQPSQRDNQINVKTIAITVGVFIPVCFLCILFAYVVQKRGYHVCKTKKDTESSKEEECKSLLSVNDLNNKESPLDQDVFKQWQEDNKTFVSTRACKEVEQLINTQNLVVVTGNSGSGKSAIIQHIALSFRSDGWTVKPVYSVKEIIDAFPPPDDLNRKTLLVFNDPIGNEFFHEEKNKLWKDHEGKLKGCLRKNKMLVSCRRYILNDARVRGILKDTSCTCIIDLNDDQHQLDNDEKHKMLEKHSLNSHFSKDDINKIMKTEDYFPLLCKLYFSDKNIQKMGLRYFEEPFDAFQEQIRHFRKTCRENYCALLLLVLFNNELCIQDIRRSEQSKNKFKLALELCGMCNTVPHNIGDSLDTLRGFFVKKIGDTYHFYHDFVMEVTTYVFGTDYPRETIRYAEIGFLRRRVNLKSSNDNRNEMKLENGDYNIDKFTIYLNNKYVSDLGDRLFNEMFGDRMLDVVLNPCMRNKKLVTLFIQKLKDSPDKLSKLLTKKRLHQQFRNQEDNQTLKQSIGSKLEFLYFEDEVPILSAIIVFCHTNVSKHCLETLQRMQNPLKGISLFSAVCCNGSMDLFNVFPKEQIKNLTMEVWGQYYPIHIVSLFHNHEILHELIQVKKKVNLRTREEYGYTPLMLAAFRTDKSEQKNKETRNQSIDITVEVLLTHGANINLCHIFAGSPLHIASAEGNDYTVKLLLDKGAKIDLYDKTNETALHKASKQGHESTVQLLLDNGADANSCDTNKETPLHKASKEGHNSTVELLLDKGAVVNSCDTREETPLHKACGKGHESTVQLLLDKGADINSSDTNKETPLHKASEEGHDSTVELLLDKGAVVNSCDTREETPLHKACGKGHQSTVQLLLDKGADINSRNTNNEIPLHKACRKGHESTVQLLLDKGADIYSCNRNKEFPLHKASEKGNECIVQLLLNKGADINQCNANKETPLHKACGKGHESTVQLLIDQGADINLCDTYWETSLYKAIKCGKERIVQLLLYKGADINSRNRNKEFPLHKASEKGNECIVQLLLNKGADINLCNANKETPLHKASEGGHESTVQLLLEKGANINSCDENEETPLHKASECGKESTVQLLLDNGADINSYNTDQETPLHKAIRRGQENTVQLLLARGADINFCDTKKETLLHDASFWGGESIVQLLLVKGADINSCDANKKTALHKASERGHNRTVKLLLDKGADINSCDTNKETPLHKASKSGHESTVQLLIDEGANINSLDANKETPLHKDRKRGHETIVQCLLDKEVHFNL